MSVPVPQAADRPDVAIFLPSLEGGGAERVMAILASGIVARGYRVELVLAAARGPYLAGLDPRVRVVDLGTDSILRSAVPLARYLRAHRPRALLAAMTHANVVALMAHRWAGGAGRVVISERLSLTAARRHHRSFHDRAIRALMWPTYRWADRLIVVAEAMVGEFKRALRLPDDRLACIYNPVVDAALLAAAERPCEHPWLSTDASLPVVLGCGRLTNQKDFATLIEAFRRVRRHRPARLLILGEGESRAALIAQVRAAGIEQDVDLPGFEENPFAFMRRAAVFVLSSRYEGMPGALVQAMACGAPLVSTDCPTGPDEILENGRWGTLVPVGDVAAMAAAIERVLAAPSPDARARAAAFAEETAVTRYLAALGLPAYAAGVAVAGSQRR
ncbi:glycosyltransferase [Sphingomonas yunnanensis]|uniref:glycosyltransferase n=1 Tax=Sphingomonas yunnanensis TaxID=310400 RepID=UPI001CA61884|nr:glycosyltransferase [Sphingomonas yunnanensis]MBY9063466.1 glycosyltransferase [Sphingomonas yunnanensis]